MEPFIISLLSPAWTCVFLEKKKHQFPTQNLCFAEQLFTTDISPTKSESVQPNTITIFKHQALFFLYYLNLSLE